MTEVEKMAIDYINQVYKNIDENSLQYKELKQTFIMGIWAFLQISKHENFTKETLSLMEAEIISYHKTRMKELGHFINDPDAKIDDLKI